MYSAAMHRFIQQKWFPVAFFLVVFSVLFFLWLPGVKYPIVSDTAYYSFLGENMWNHFRFALFDVPYAKHLPLHAFVSYPFVWLFGYSLGMKVSTLVAGYAVLVFAFLLFDKVMSRSIAVLSVLFLSVHHAFVFMTQLGSADLLFTALFLCSLYGYIRAKEDARFYILAFFAAGLSCITRYNGVPLFGLFAVHTLLYRRTDMFRRAYLLPAIAGGMIFGAWLARNWLVFGDPLHTEYTTELSSHTQGFFVQVYSNVLYYLNPIHNLLPILFACALFGLVRHRKQYGFLFFAMCTAWIITSFWWVQAMRFAFPGYVILMGFAILGFQDLWAYVSSHYSRVFAGVILGFLSVTVFFMHAGALCLYAYGECNAYFDRITSIAPKDLGLTSEGFYAWNVARNFLVEHGDPSIPLYVSDRANAHIWHAEHVAGSQIRITHNTMCDVYRIAQNVPEHAEVLFTTTQFPQTSVLLQRCP